VLDPSFFSIGSSFLYQNVPEYPLAVLVGMNVYPLSRWERVRERGK
jgi:hypothetical protein